MSNICQKLTPEPGVTKSIFTGKDFTDIEELIAACRSGLREHPASQLSVVDEPSRRRTGFHLELIEDAYFYWWQFFIGVKDLKKSLIRHPEWQGMMNQTGRMELAAMLEKTRNVPPEEFEAFCTVYAVMHA